MELQFNNINIVIFKLFPIMFSKGKELSYKCYHLIKLFDEIIEMKTFNSDLMIKIFFLLFGADLSNNDI